MEITEVNVRLIEEQSKRVLAFCSITFDNCFVVRDVKIIAGPNDIFIAMPSRKVTARCPRCQSKNSMRAFYCNHCGHRLPPESEDFLHRTTKLYADIAHPINQQCREMIQKRVLAAYHQELELSQQPGYISSYQDTDYDDEGLPNMAVEGPHFSRTRRAVQPNSAGFGAGILD
ncbi:MAG: septation protein SpoVG family protein [Planctomycetaceae bacterium]|jgi:stage V sporulation protein G|nr:septation protein SpoVG family protein [Planctomycetaceae bacterium]